MELAAKTCQDLDQQLSEKSTQLQQVIHCITFERVIAFLTLSHVQVEARFERVNAKNKDLKHELKTKSAKVRDVQLFVQDTVCEAVTREEVLREKVSSVEQMIFVNMQS